MILKVLQPSLHVKQAHDHRQWPSRSEDSVFASAAFKLKAMRAILRQLLYTMLIEDLRLTGKFDNAQVGLYHSTVGTDRGPLTTSRTLRIAMQNLSEMPCTTAFDDELLPT